MPGDRSMKNYLFRGFFGASDFSSIGAFPLARSSR